ncbi:MAG: hypothetical protein LBL73_09790 [Synergistaceae bacterium]|jgi:SPP1 gp7 family putative phage head morphogenesis protein|nr:hypothetical protein [Synergistaceae bacterium]
MGIPALTPIERHEAALRLSLIVEKAKRIQSGKAGGSRERLLRQEKALAAELAAQWRKAYTDALKDIFDSIPGELAEDAMKLAEDALLSALGPAFGNSAAVRGLMKKNIEAAYADSKREWALKTPKDRKSPLLSLPDRRAVEVLTRHNCFWLGERYGEHVGPKVSEIAREALDSGLGRKALAEELRRRLGGVAPEDYRYWDVAASSALVRARSFGAISGMEEAEIAEYEVLAMGDERMCPICGEMNGRTFSVAETRRVIDSALGIKDPAAFKKALPWQSKPAKGMTDAELCSGGQSIPPFHGRCRCVLVTAGEASEKPTLPSPLDPPGMKTPKGKPMDHEEALKGTNPKYSRSSYAYSHNCQRCVPAYELRRRGYNVTARPKPAGADPIYSNRHRGTNVWVDGNGNPLARIQVRGKSGLEKALKAYPDNSRFSVGIEWKGRGRSSHVFTAEKKGGKIYYYDPQDGTMDASRCFQRGENISYSRIDDAQFSPNIDISDVVETKTP